MAALICPRGHDDPGDGTMCAHCGEYLRKAPPPATGPTADETPRESPRDEPRQGSRRAAPAPLTCEEPGCDLELDEDGCPLHGGTVPRPSAPPRHPGTPTSADPSGSGGHALSLVFPWGAHAVGRAPLVVGRSTDEAGELAERMIEYGRWTGNDYRNISRAHAVVWSDAVGTWIRHIGGTNVTRLNGRPLEGDQPHRLRAGDLLAFAKGLRAHVEGAQPPNGPDGSA